MVQSSPIRNSATANPRKQCPKVLVCPPESPPESCHQTEQAMVWLALLTFRFRHCLWKGPDFDGVHMLSTDCPELSPLIHRQTKLSVLETSILLRCVAVRLCRSL